MAAREVGVGEKRAAVERARALMLAGASQNKAAEAIGRECGVSGRTIKNWAVALGTPLGSVSQDGPKRAALGNARAALASYAQERRLALSDRFFSRLETVLEGATDARDLKELATAYGILTDKRRLEEGLATEHSVSETRQAASAAAIFEEGRERLRILRGSAGGE